MSESKLANFLQRGEIKTRKTSRARHCAWMTEMQMFWHRPQALHLSMGSKKVLQTQVTRYPSDTHTKIFFGIHNSWTFMVKQRIFPSNCNRWGLRASRSGRQVEGCIRAVPGVALRGRALRRHGAHSPPAASRSLRAPAAPSVPAAFPPPLLFKMLANVFWNNFKFTEKLQR